MPASLGRLGGLFAVATLVGACQLAFGLGDYAGVAAEGGAVGAAGYGGASTTISGAGGTSTGGGAHGGASAGGSGGSTGTPTPDGPCQCVGALQAGWSYVYVFSSPDLAGALSDCGGQKAPKVLRSGAPVGPVACGACACAPPDGSNCATPKLLCAGGDGCSGAAELPVEDVCKFVGTPAAFSGSCQLADTAVAAGTCQASGGGVTSRPDWQSALSLCSAAPESRPDCPSSCVVPVIGAKTCITRDGNALCTVPGFPNKLDAWGGASDARDCTACSCEPSFTCAGGGYVFYEFDTGSCWGSTQSIASTSCTPVPSSFGAKRLPATAGGSCSIHGGAPMGAFTAADPATVCCAD